MRSLRSGNQAAIDQARDLGLVPRQFFTITVRDRDSGDPQAIGLWTGDDTIDAAVISGADGLEENRTFVGGVNLTIGDIPRVADLTVRSIEITFSAIADICQQIVRGFDARLAQVELHAGWLDVDSRQLADVAEIDFLGIVDAAPIETGAAGQESIIKLTVVSDAALMLSRTNPRKRSYEAQKRRGGDEFALYANTVANWRVVWGEQGSGPAQRSGSK